MMARYHHQLLGLRYRAFHVGYGFLDVGVIDFHVILPRDHLRRITQMAKADPCRLKRHEVIAKRALAKCLIIEIHYSSRGLFCFGSSNFVHLTSGPTSIIGTGRSRSTAALSCRVSSSIRRMSTKCFSTSSLRSSNGASLRYVATVRY